MITCCGKFMIWSASTGDKFTCEKCGKVVTVTFDSETEFIRERMDELLKSMPKPIQGNEEASE